MKKKKKTSKANSRAAFRHRIPSHKYFPRLIFFSNYVKNIPLCKCFLGIAKQSHIITYIKRNYSNCRRPEKKVHRIFCRPYYCLLLDELCLNHQIKYSYRNENCGRTQHTCTRIVAFHLLNIQWIFNHPERKNESPKLNFIYAIVWENCSIMLISTPVRQGGRAWMESIRDLPPHNTWWIVRLVSLLLSNGLLVVTAFFPLPFRIMGCAMIVAATRFIAPGSAYILYMVSMTGFSIFAHCSSGNAMLKVWF